VDDTSTGTQLTLQQDVSLQLMGGAALTCGAETLKFVDGIVSLDATLAPETWATVVADRALGLVPDALVTGGPELLDPKLPVHVRLRLRDGMPTGLQLQHVADHLIRGAGAGAEAASWVVCEALQDVELPEAIDGTGRLGFRTAWSAEPVARSSDLERLTTEWLLGAGAEVESVGPGLARAPMEADGHQWILVIRTDENTRTVGFYSVLPQLVPEDARHGIALFLMGQNYEMPFGSFEMDPDDGEVRLRTAWAGGPEETPTEEELYELVAPHAPVVAAHIDAVNGLVEELLASGKATG